VRVAVIATTILYAAVFFVLVTTPEGDKDSHAHLAFALMVYVSPCALILSVIALVSSLVTHAKRMIAAVTTAFALAPIILVASLIFGWV